MPTLPAILEVAVIDPATDRRERRAIKCDLEIDANNELIGITMRNAAGSRRVLKINAAGIPHTEPPGGGP